MWSFIYSQQFHFALHLFGSLVFFSAGWLYLDAYQYSSKYLIPRIAGFFLLSIASLVGSLQIDLVYFITAASQSPNLAFLSFFLTFSGYILILASFPKSIFQKKPVYRALFPILGPLRIILTFLKPLGALAITGMFYTNVAEGLEWHLLLPSVAFFSITISEVMQMFAGLFNTSTNIFFQNLAVPFGLFWWLEHIFLLVGLILLFRWVFWYLLKSFEMQMVFIATACVIILTVTITTIFANLLSSSLFAEISTQMTQSVKVFSYGIESLKRSALADAKFISVDTRLISAINNQDTVTATQIVQDFSTSRTVRHIMVIGIKGASIVRNDQDNIFSELDRFKTITDLSGQGVESSTLFSLSGVLTPAIYIAAAVPIRDKSTIIGTVLLANTLDDSFLRGIKKDTGLEGTLFAGNILAATSLNHSETLVGIKETDKTVQKKVLTDGNALEGMTVLDNTQYMGSYLPVKDINGVTIGMMFAGIPFGEIFQIIARAIGATYILAIIFLILSVPPALFTARYVIRQMH